MVDELQQSHTRLLDAFDVVPEGLVLLDAEGRYVLFNKGFVDLYDTFADKITIGASFAESVRVGVERGHYPDAIGREAEWLAERLDGNRLPARAAEQRICRDRWVAIRERRTADGGSIGVRIDITDLKRREEVLKQRSDQLVEAQRLGKMADWTLGVGHGGVWWSPLLYELLAFDSSTFSPTFESMMNALLNDSAERILAALSLVESSRSAQSVDVQLRRGDGSIGDFVITLRAKLDGDGPATEFAGTVQDISERKNAERRLERLAYYDPLTGLANRAMFQKEIGDVFARCQSTGSSAALLLLDLDRFKEVNDSLGHSVGDDLLARVAQLFSAVLGGGQFISRLGGDEFAIIMLGYKDTSAIIMLANQLIGAVAHPIALQRSEVSIGASIGIALIPGDGDDPTDLQRNADLALYSAKDAGRGRFTFFQKELKTSAQHKVALASELRRALVAGDGLAVHYQPQVRLSDGQVVGFEALARWHHPLLGYVSPSEFIPIAENSQLICELGLWVLRQAASQAKQWLDIGETAREMSVNVSAAQIWHADFVSDVAKVLSQTELPPHLLCLELTESLMANYSEMKVRRVMLELKELGVKLALDDFGTHYSSLGYLTQLPFDKIKIDRMFIRGIVDSDRARKLLAGIVALGRGLGLRIVVEGPETSDELAILLDLDCDIAQGFVLAKAMVSSEALDAARWFQGRTPSVEPGALALRAAALRAVAA